MVRNTLPPLLLQLVSPAFQLRHDGFDLGRLLDRVRFDTCDMLVAEA